MVEFLYLQTTYFSTDKIQQITCLCMNFIKSYKIYVVTKQNYRTQIKIKFEDKLLLVQYYLCTTKEKTI